MSFFNFTTRCIGIDLGTTSIKVAMKDKGVIINEPSVVAIDTKKKTLIATGYAAKEMLGRSPDKIKVVRPLKNGVIADLSATEMMLKNIMNRINRKYGMARTKAVVGVPSGITEVEKRAVEEAVYDAGVKEVYLIDEPLAAAIGCNINIAEPTGVLIVDMGSGTTEVAVISMGGIVVTNSIRVAGDDLDKNIIDYVRKFKSLDISESCAEQIKMSIATVKPGVLESMEIKGRDLKTGLPKEITINSEQVLYAIEPSVNKIISSIKLTLEKTPPELATDITERGILLTGGLANLKKIDELILDKTGINTYIALEPMQCVALGTEKSLADVSKLKQLQSKRRR